MTLKNIDTIAAISTPFGEGGIGIIRISGDEALSVGRSVFVPRGGKEIKERYLNYGDFICPADKSVIDNGFLIYMRGPMSYTGTDVVELQCHGGPLILKKALEAVLLKGARMADPGEFTKRAFLNGKLDLTQAEAVIDVIRAHTEKGLIAARGRLLGRLSKKVNEIKEGLVALLVRIEAGLDFPDEEIDGLPEDIFLSVLEEGELKLNRLISTYDEGAILKDGVRVLILGRTNVGKSSLLNILLQEERAIVTEVPGTTRDIIEEAVNIGGIAVRLMDTAGLRNTSDIVESIGIRAAFDRISASRLILFVIDVSTEGFEEDIRLLESAKDKKVIIVANKTDRAGRLDGIKKTFNGYRVVFTSALKGTGIDELKSAIYEETIGRSYERSGDADPGELIVSARHKDSLIKALEAISRIRHSIATTGLEQELIAADLRQAVDRLGEITGEVTTEDILDRIFSEFCIGK